MLFVCSSVILVLNLILPVNAIVAQETAKIAQQNQAAVASLQNEDVLKMVESGLSPDIIVAKIKVSACKFDTSPTALQKLKTASVPEPVILAMVQAPFGVAASAPEGSRELERSVALKVPDGTPLEVELISTISSASMNEGDFVDFRVVSTVYVNGVVVIDKGAPAKARIASVKKAGFWGKAGKLGWTMRDVLLVDGSRQSVRMDYRLVGDSKGGTVATATIITAAIFWPVAPFWGLKKGKNAVYSAGTRFNAFVNGDVFIKVKPATAQLTPAITQESQLTAPVKP